jgi:hypothetical protein
MTWSSRFERYAIPLLPTLSLLAGVALVRIGAWVGARGRLADRFGPRAAPAVIGSIVVLLLAPQLARVVTYHQLLGRPDTRELGSRWIERQVPPGTRIALEPLSVSLPVARRQIREAPWTLAGLQQAVPPTLGSPPARREDGYWLVRLETYDLDRLVGDGVEYVVLSGFVYQRYRRACDRHPAPCRFYAELDARAELVFSASSGVEDATLPVGDIYSPLTRLRERRHPGPPIRIYRLPVEGRA